MTTEQQLRTLQEISSIPMTLFAQGEAVFHAPKLPFLEALSRHTPKELLEVGGNAACVLTDELLHFGIVKIDGLFQYAIFGPVSTIACDNQKAQRILRSRGLPTSEAGQVVSFFRGMPICSLHKFTSFICFVNYVINHETLDIVSLLPRDYRLESEVMLTEPDSTPERIAGHDAREYEREMFSLIRYGKYDAMLTFIHHSPFTGSQGMLADTVSRHQKNLVISSITLSARAALEGGLDYETSMSLADGYIQKVELTPQTNALLVLHKNMLKTYARLVAETKRNNAESVLAAKVHGIIERHITESLTTVDIAREMKLHRAYLSTQFKKDTGMNLGDFINKIKVNEAMRLLVTTKRTVSEIADILAFSSQSHFHTVFKRFAGMTPREYRGRVYTS